MSSNPANDVPYIKTSSEGFHTWTVPEVEQYRTQHVVGTKARLALELLLYLGGRRSDVVSFGRQHVRTPDQMPEEARAVHPGRWLHYMQHKNRHRKPVVLTIPILEELEAILAASPIGELTWLVNDLGRPFTSNGFGNKMRDWCDQAGLLHCSAHGLRKAGATIAAERGASDRALMSIFGWTTSKQAAHYTRKADQMRLAGANMKLLAGRR